MKDIFPKIKDLSAIFDSSLIINSSKYPSPKKRLKLCFIAVAGINKIEMFIITVKIRIEQNLYEGYDCSSFCYIIYSAMLTINKRYVVYGKVVGASNPRSVFVEYLKPFDSRELCYKIL
ncbi:hypothetical protein CWI38_1926p0030 [Hamiltosporidium tvaerminnensis]|uniref:Uncharacterized protein n=2 Tax=Hamiltosporidium TaxID=1176354 RepID=A0A4Q9L7Z2_9MICR|nr:hypothetical protein CWI37_1170p0030 [Hamiltosporidium tvaerminnensis]TBU03819.1 hypothetical protein CWI36_0856p0020 [Hamiltosporidium magnivora]TBU07552.1 hypothetical protein CWI39_0302p0010 [Hamiltosporidium magnivora]TBU10231.1 hypothetical protein CWI38_1926p0030 [Hamiltosporidium tvaerminnensis]